MTNSNNSFHTWLSSKLQTIFSKQDAWILCCDHRQEWPDFLKLHRQHHPMVNLIHQLMTSATSMNLMMYGPAKNSI